MNLFESLNGVPPNLAQGTVFSMGNTNFQISYLGENGGLAGGNNLVLLAVIPEPARALLFLAGLPLLLRRRRRR